MRPAPAGRLVVLTDRAQAAIAGHDLLDVVTAAAGAGADLVVLREKDLPAGERAALAEQVAGALRGDPTRLAIASDPGLAAAVGASGVHLAAADEPGGSEPRPALVGRSCHDRHEVEAARLGVWAADYVTVSPVFPTASKPGHGPALGVDAALGLVPDGLPAYALGGIDAGTAASCLAAGFAGVAVMGAVMGAPDPDRATGELREALDAVTVAS